MQVEIMSRSPRPKRKTIKDYMKRVQKRLCVSPKDMETTKQGNIVRPAGVHYNHPVSPSVHHSISR